jgi:hypothetical protein
MSKRFCRGEGDGKTDVPYGPSEQPDETPTDHVKEPVG